MTQQEHIIALSRRNYSPLTVASLAGTDAVTVQRAVRDAEAEAGKRAEKERGAAERRGQRTRGERGRSLATITRGLGLPRPWGRFAYNR